MSNARDIVTNALADVAPELEVSELDPKASLRDGADLDSMDFLAFVAAISEAIGADIPEADYPHLDGLAKAEAYVADHGN
jgi:acyl carrier protein